MALARGPVSQDNLSPGNLVVATVFPKEIKSLPINVATVYPKEILSPGNTVARMLAVFYTFGKGVPSVMRGR